MPKVCPRQAQEFHGSNQQTTILPKRAASVVLEKLLPHGRAVVPWAHLRFLTTFSGKKIRHFGRCLENSKATKKT